MARKSAGRTIADAVREICLSFPEAIEIVSHGSPNFRVGKGRIFATFVVNHHGDGRIALWLPAAPGAQPLRVENEPEHYFVPPYVGPSGWLGVHLDRGLDWQAIAERVREGYVHVAPKKLAAALGPAIRIAPPNAALAPDAIDPMQQPHAQALLAEVRAIALELPEASEDRQFGRPAFRAGGKTFCVVGHHDGSVTLQAWVGPDAQTMLTFDERYRIPPYIGRNGWIALDLDASFDREEVRGLLMGSYRHFALKRMLAAFEARGASDGGSTRPAPAERTRNASSVVRRRGRNSAATPPARAVPARRTKR